jgi:Tol biopolymer transport system component
MKKATKFAGIAVISTALLFPTIASASKTDQILFSGGPIGNTSIYKLDADTTEVKKITAGSEVDVTPDGRKMAFIRNDSLYVADLNGRNAVRLTNSQFPTYDSSPRWSPDGKKIVFARSDGNIYTIDADGKNLTNLTHVPENGTIHNSEPDWSPDGSKIIFQSDRTGRTHIFTMNADGTDVKQLTGDNSNATAEYSAHYSPDGSKIVYGETNSKGKSDIFVMNADGSHPVNLTPDTKEAVASPIWSEDGTKILYTVNDPNQDTQDSTMYIMDANGSNKTSLKLSIEFANPYDWKQLGIFDSSGSGSGLRSTLKQLKSILFD